MATNKNALIRYRTIDKCLQNRTRRWTLENLIDACSEALYEFEGRHSNVSIRTVQLDLQVMRSNKLGYNAPITVYHKKYYTYQDEHYSITDTPLTKIDMDILTESVQMLEQFKDFSLFTELNGVIQKLEDKIYRESHSKSPIIHIEKNENLRGLNFLDTLYQGILKKIVLRITYQSFKAKVSSEFLFHAYILKEYNNRWFLVGRRHRVDKLETLALDRILDLGFELGEDYVKENFDADEYYKDTYGVTVMTSNQLLEITMKVDKFNAPYILTKPIHNSQKLIERHADGSITLYLRVHHNFEIERLIMGFGEGVEIIKPLKLRNRIKSKLQWALNNYLK